MVQMRLMAAAIIVAIGAAGFGTAGNSCSCNPLRKPRGQHRRFDHCLADVQAFSGTTSSQTTPSPGLQPSTAYRRLHHVQTTPSSGMYLNDRSASPGLAKKMVRFGWSKLRRFLGGCLLGADTVQCRRIQPGNVSPDVEPLVVVNTTSTNAQTSPHASEPERSFAAEERKVMLLLDTSASMAFPTSAKNPTSRNFIVREAIGVVMSELKGEPSQDSRGSDRGAGLRAITFAGGHSNDIGELNPENLQEKWDQIVWGGMTYLMPGWLELNRVFDEEFGRLNADHGQPPFMAVVVTDGEAPDIDKFELALTQDKRATLVIICVGYGEQHQYVLRSFHRIAESNPRVKVVNFVGNDDPNEHAGSSNA